MMTDHNDIVNVIIEAFENNNVDEASAVAGMLALLEHILTKQENAAFIVIDDVRVTVNITDEPTNLTKH